MQRRVVNLGDEAADLPYSSAVYARGDFIYTSGHAGFVPETGEAPAGIQAQTEQALENLREVLEAAGTKLEHVVKVNVYLAEVEDFAAMNEVYRRYFPSDRPARSTVGARLVRPDLLVEIEMVALLPGNAQ
ncbi:MAG: RidA family protein [Acidimicrobiia bacterium]